MSKFSLEIPGKKFLLSLAIMLVIAVVGWFHPLIWPGGLGIGKDQSITTKSVETVVKDAQGNTTKTIETTKIDDGRTLWDWLSLLGVPLSLVVLGYILQQLQQKRAEVLAKEQREIAADETKEEVLQVYFDRLSVLLVDKNLLAIAAKEQATDEERELLASAMDVIRARTLSILRRFENDPERKISVIRFLIEADFVSQLKLNLSGARLTGADLSSTSLSSVNLSHSDLSSTSLVSANLTGANLTGANLTDANLIGANLIDANLSGANLSGVNLSGSKLIGSNLTGADLRGADLWGAGLTYAKLHCANFRGADLSDADLSGADLSDANLTVAALTCAKLRDVNLSVTDLSGANLSDSDLSGARALTAKQLKTAKLCRTVLPEGITTLNPNRDCEALGFSES
jgi:uncharacterized protein YjbI with pentapeptide repeats